jgi:putative copper export protein
MRAKSRRAVRSGNCADLIAAAAWVGGLLPLALMLAAAGASVTVAQAVSLRS